jgi:hypothetical protein
VQIEALLQSIQDRKPTFENGLTNHAPMLAIALNRLGVDETIIENKTDTEARRALRFSPHAKSLREDEISTHFGDRSAYPLYFHTFQKFRGVGALSSWQISALEGLAGDGFHGLIRLAYGLEAKSTTEIAAGWAYLCTSHLKLLAASGALAVSITERMKQLRAEMLRPLPEQDLIWQALDAAARLEIFHAFTLSAESATLAALGSNALDLYLSAPGIDTLHAITASHALRIVISEFGDIPSARLALGYAIVAMAIAIGAPAVPVLKSETVTASDWNELVPLALPRDIHTIKFLYTCREMWKVTDDLRYFVAARARVRGVALS